MPEDYIGCGKVPIKADLDKITNVSKSTKLRLVALAPGTGTAQKRGNVYGVLSISENPTTSFFVSGVEYSLVETTFHTSGPFHVFDSMAASSAELRFVFQRTNRPSETAILCLPVVVKDASAALYFQTLGLISSKHPTITGLFTADAEFVHYIGAVGCSSTGPSGYTKYFVSTAPAFIRLADMNRLTKLAGATATASTATATAVGKPITPLAPAELSYLTRIQSIVLQSKDPRIKSSSATTATATTTKQIKCRPLDRSRDIRNGTIYVGGEAVPGETTLEKELEQAARADAVATDSDSNKGVSPADIERIMAIIFGVVIALFIIGACVVLYFRRTTWNYDAVQAQYNGLLEKASATIGESLDKATVAVRKGLRSGLCAGATATATATAATRAK